MVRVGAVVTDTNVIQLQAALSQQWLALKGAFNAWTAPHTPAGATLVAQMDAMDARVTAFIDMTPSYWLAASQMDQGQQLQADLQPIYDLLNKAGVPNVPAKPAAPPPDGLGSLFSNVQGVLLLVAVIYALHEFGGRR
jgi:hypothetical protein